MSSYLPVYRVRLVRDGNAGAYPRCADPRSVARVLQGWLPDDGIEHFGIVLLDVRHRLTGIHEVSTGCLTASLVHPREVFAVALVHKAAAIILFHNHPSGDPEPSAEDVALTRRLAAGGALLGVEVLDHVIVGDGGAGFVSLKERGVL